MNRKDLISSVIDGLVSDKPVLATLPCPDPRSPFKGKVMVVMKISSQAAGFVVPLIWSSTYGELYVEI